MPLLGCTPGAATRTGRAAAQLSVVRQQRSRARLIATVRGATSLSGLAKNFFAGFCPCSAHPSGPGSRKPAPDQLAPWTGSAGRDSFGFARSAGPVCAPGSTAVRPRVIKSIGCRTTIVGTAARLPRAVPWLPLISCSHGTASHGGRAAAQLSVVRQPGSRRSSAPVGRAASSLPGLAKKFFWRVLTLAPVGAARTTVAMPAPDQHAPWTWSAGKDLLQVFA